MKRFLSVILSLIMMLAVALPAFAEGESAIKRNADGLPDFEGRTFTIWYRNRQPQTTDDLTNMEVVKKLEEMLNCQFVFIHPPQGQEQDHFAITMADDKLPDMIFCGAVDSYYPGGITMAYEDGILYDYTSLINETNTPNFYNLFMNDDYLAPLAKDDYGRIIRLGAKIQGSEDCDNWYGCLVLRKDILAATGLDVPETVSDWYEVLTAIKANGIEYPLFLESGWWYELFPMAYGIKIQELFLNKDGKVTYGPYEDVYKDYLAEMNKWYTEGLINADFMNANAADGISLLLDGKAGAYSAHIWNWPFSYDILNTDPEKELVGAQYPKLNDEDELTNLRNSGRKFDDYKYITADAEDPLACVVLLDTLYNEDISTMMSNGIEGVAWERDEVGYPAPIDNADPLFKGISEWHAYEDNVGAWLDSKWTKPAADYLRMTSQCGTSGYLPSRYLMFTTEEAEVRNRLQTDIDTYALEMQLKFITGQESLDKFDAYRDQLKTLGVEELLQVYQSAYDRLQARR